MPIINNLCFDTHFSFGMSVTLQTLPLSLNWFFSRIIKQLWSNAFRSHQQSAKMSEKTGESLAPPMVISTLLLTEWPGWTVESQALPCLMQRTVIHFRGQYQFLCPTFITAQHSNNPM